MLVGMDHKFYSDFWGFVAEYLLNYTSRNEVLRSDILRRFLDDEALCYDDFLMIYDEYGGNKENVKNALVELEASLAREALEAYYDEYFSSVK